jgi:hypothetical protein
MAGIVADGWAKSAGKWRTVCDLHPGPVRMDGSGAKTFKGQGGREVGMGEHWDRVAGRGAEPLPVGG